jgi:hypothetical protein
VRFELTLRVEAETLSTTQLKLYESEPIIYIRMVVNARFATHIRALLHIYITPSSSTIPTAVAAAAGGVTSDEKQHETQQKKTETGVKQMITCNAPVGIIITITVSSDPHNI